MKRTALLLLVCLFLLSFFACDNGPYEIEIGGEIIFRDEGVRGPDDNSFEEGGAIFPSDGVDLPSVRP